MLLPIHPDNPQGRLISQVVDTLRNDGVIIYPTDTVYALGCNMFSKKAMARVCQIKGIDPNKAQFSCICPDLATIGQFAIMNSNQNYKLIKQTLPGPFTFILPASKEVPRYFQSRRKTIGIRMIDHPIANAIVTELGNPILSSSLPVDTEDYFIEAEDFFDTYGHQVDLVVSGGTCGTEASTVIDLSGREVILVRQGKGDLEEVGIEVED